MLLPKSLNNPLGINPTTIYIVAGLTGYKINAGNKRSFRMVATFDQCIMLRPFLLENSRVK